MTGVWQPIETAPTDGSAVLLYPYMDDWANMYVVYGYATLDGEWFSTVDGLTFEPTHWMPLPEPPEEKL